MNAVEPYWLHVDTGSEFGGVRQQTITRTNLDTDRCRYIASLGHNKLKQRECMSDTYLFKSLHSTGALAPWNQHE